MKSWLEKKRKTLKKWRSRYKAFKILKGIVSGLIFITNIAITLWQFYEQFLKERFEGNA